VRDSTARFETGSTYGHLLRSATRCRGWAHVAGGDLASPLGNTR
jgi:hypothetical protein